MPVVENPPLARALYKAVDLDQDIPVEHYKAVAEVIGYVMRSAPEDIDDGRGASGTGQAARGQDAMSTNAAARTIDRTQRSGSAGAPARARGRAGGRGYRAVAAGQREGPAADHRAARAAGRGRRVRALRRRGRHHRVRRPRAPQRPDQGGRRHRARRHAGGGERRSASPTPTRPI